MKFKAGVKRAEISNAIDQYVTGTIGEVWTDWVPGGLCCCGLMTVFRHPTAESLLKTLNSGKCLKYPNPRRRHCCTLSEPLLPGSRIWITFVGLYFPCGL